MTDDFDPTDEAERELGRGVFEADMGPGSSLAHVYRAEVHRMTRWRERLDQTTNWAVTVMAAILTWAFSSPSNPHYLVLVGFLTVLIFLGIEAHRFRGFDVWRSRVRLIQKNVWAQGFDPSDPLEDREWRRELGDDYERPTVKVPYEEAVAHRLRRIYLALLSVVLAAWIVRITAFSSESVWPASAAIGIIPGIAVTGLIVLVYLVAVAVALRPREWHSHAELRTESIDEWQ